MTLHPDPIDLAARAMTDGEPPSDLEERIKRRLDAETQTRPRTARWPIIAGFATAVATVLIVVAQGLDVTKSRSPEVPGTTGPRHSEVAAVLESRNPDVIEAGPREPRNSGTSEPRQPRDSGTSTRRSEAELAWMSRRIAALDVIDPLEVDRLQFESIQPEPMVITPLTMTPLVTSPVMGDPDTGRQR